MAPTTAGWAGSHAFTSDTETLRSRETSVLQPAETSGVGRGDARGRGGEGDNRIGVVPGPWCVLGCLAVMRSSWDFLVTRDISCNWNCSESSCNLDVSCDAHRHGAVGNVVGFSGPFDCSESRKFLMCSSVARDIDTFV